MALVFGISSAVRFTLGLVLVLNVPAAGNSEVADAISPDSLRSGAQPVRPDLTADPACSRADDNPTALTADVTGTTVTLRWFAPFGCTPSSYIVVAGPGPNASNIAQIPSGSASTTLTATGVPPGIYYVRVLSQAGATRSTPSNEVVVTVGATCAPPAAPPALWVTASAATATLEWDAASGSPESYIIEAGSAPGLTNLVTLDTGSPATAFSTPAPLGTYHVRVRARNACATGPASNEVIVAVAVPTPMPPVVTVTGLVELRGTQVVVISSANVTVRNRINLYDRSILIIRDSVFNHVADYASQFDLWAYDNAKVIIESGPRSTRPSTRAGISSIGRPCR